MPFDPPVAEDHSAYRHLPISKSWVAGAESSGAALVAPFAVASPTDLVVELCHSEPVLNLQLSTCLISDR